MFVSSCTTNLPTDYWHPPNQLSRTHFCRCWIFLDRYFENVVERQDESFTLHWWGTIQVWFFWHASMILFDHPLIPFCCQFCFAVLINWPLFFVMVWLINYLSYSQLLYYCIKHIKSFIIGILFSVVINKYNRKEVLLLLNIILGHHPISETFWKSNAEDCGDPTINLPTIKTSIQRKFGEFSSSFQILLTDTMIGLNSLPELYRTDRVGTFSCFGC